MVDQLIDVVVKHRQQFIIRQAAVRTVNFLSGIDLLIRDDRIQAVAVSKMTGVVHLLSTKRLRNK